MIKYFFFKIVAIGIGVSLSLLVTEVLLRLFVPALVKVDIQQLDLHSFEKKNQLIIDNLKESSFYNPKLDSIIYRSVNNLGFRGADLPDSNSKLYKIIAVGGSTTICHYLSDGDDWPTRVGNALRLEDSSIWMNNAGIDGHSTFGHLTILPEIILPIKPQLILFLVGCNDVERAVPRDFDDNRPQHSFGFSKPNYIRYFYDHLFTYRLWKNMVYAIQRKKMTDANRVYHQNIDFNKAVTMATDSVLKMQKINTQLREFVPPYKKRLLRMIELCRVKNVMPVFITQPSILGSGVDSTTGVDLGKISYDGKVNGEIYWSMLQVYNQALKEVCAATNCCCIDLAAAMPKNSIYYYDYFHFTKQGSAQVADIVLNSLRGIIKSKKGNPPQHIPAKK